MRIITRPLSRRIGFRGTSLLLFGIVWVTFGLFQFWSPSPALRHEPNVIGLFVPIHWMGLLWMASGLLAIGFSFVDNARHPARDTTGFVAAEVPPLLWALNYLASGIFLDYPRGIATAFIWVVCAGIIMNEARWPEPARTKGIS